MHGRDGLLTSGLPVRLTAPYQHAPKGQRNEPQMAAVALTACSARNTWDKFASGRFAVVQHTLFCVLSWQNAVRVLGSAGRTRPPTPAPQMAKEMS